MGKTVMRTHAHTIVIGGGISGLSTAWWLAKAGVDVAVLEKGEPVGGTMATVHDNGWLIEKGPNSALETTPLIQTLCEDVGISGQKIYANDAASNRYILRDGVLHALPMSPGKFLTTRLWSGRGKLRLLKEPFIGRPDREETIAEFVERRLGRELLDYAINPFVAGVYAGDPSRLSVRAAFPKLYALEEQYGSLIKGQIRGAKERRQRGEVAKDRARLFSFVNGMDTLPKAIASNLNDRVISQADVVAISPMPEGYRIQANFAGVSRSVLCENVVLAVPSHVASRWIQAFDENLAVWLRSIHYPPVTELFLGYHENQIRRSLNGFGFLVPEKEKRSILGSIWSSSLFPGRAPADHVSFTTFVGGARQPELTQRSDDELTALVHSELKAIIGIDGDPVYQRVSRWQKAIPQYEIGHLDIIAAIENFERRMPGMIVGGNYRGGIAVGDCVVQSRVIADRILARLPQSMQTYGVSA